MIAPLRQRNFALLWSGGLISQIGDWLLSIGLSIYVYVLTGSALATSLALIVAFVPGVLLGSLAGVFVDRWDRRWTMIISNLLLACGLLPLLAVHNRDSLWIVYIVLFLESCIEQFVMPAQKALLPNLVSKEHLVSANSLNSLGANISRLTGGALGGFLVVLWGLRSVILLDAASFLFVCVMIWLIHMPTQEQSSSTIEAPPSIQPSAMPLTSIIAAVKRFGSEWVEGLQLISQQRVLTILFIMLAVQSLGEGVFGVMLIVFVKKVLAGDALILGSLSSLQAAGSLVGASFTGLIGNRFSPGRILGVGIIIFGLIDLAIVNVPLLIPGILPVMILFVLVGIPLTSAMIARDTLLQGSTVDKLRGRIFGTFSTVQALLMMIGMLLAGTLGDRLGPILLLNIQGSVYTLSGLLALFTLGGVIITKQVQQRSGERTA
ncbi:MAG TPA: MFS transporter [Ktedonosporobacter sp.]|nr:MFS transporter [Ktedonosporobacter sp.]